MVRRENQAIDVLSADARNVEVPLHFRTNPGDQVKRHAPVAQCAGKAPQDIPDQLSLCARSADGEGDRQCPLIGRGGRPKLGVNHATVAVAERAARIEDGNAAAQVLSGRDKFS